MSSPADGMEAPKAYPYPPEKVDEYLNTIKRLETDITMIDSGAAAASISISLKRIADNLDWFRKKIEEEVEKSK